MILLPFYKLREVDTVSEVHGLLTKIHEILYVTDSKFVGNKAYILACLFNSASR